MKEITEAIDAWMASQYNYTMKLWGYCELVTKKDQVMPRTIPSFGEGQQVAIDDRFQVNTWMRWPGTLDMGSEIEGNDWSFGLQQAPVQSATIRFVLAHKISIGEDFIHTLLKDFPRSFDIDGYSMVSVNKGAMSGDPDHEAVYKAELGETAYELHRFDWNVYAINIPVQFIPCTITSP